VGRRFALVSEPPQIRRPTFNRRYAFYGFLSWAVAVLVVSAIAAFGTLSWDDVANFAVAWGIFALAAGWTIDTIQRHRSGERQSPALDELDRRAARGEISVEEYREQRAALEE
jgi:hypothetical protein